MSNRRDSTRWAWVDRRLHDNGTGTLVLLTLTLWVASLAACYALLATPVDGNNLGLMMLTESYGALERVALWQRTLSWLPGGHEDGSFVSWPKWAIVWTVRLAFATMFAVHAIAFIAAWRSRSGTMLRWLIGPIGAQIIMLLMVPSNADVFFYAITGDIANNGLNPYATHLYEVFTHPIYPYNHWVDMTSVYGPVWTMISQATMWVTGPDPARAALGFKIVLGGAALLVGAGVYAAARLMNIPANRASAAMVLVAWQPNMIIESAGQAHNDVVMIGLVLAAVTLTIVGASRATRGGVILLMLSAAVKYVSLPILGLLELTRLDRCARPRDVRGILRAWLLDLVAIVGVVIAVFGPYWTGTSTFTTMISEPGRLYSNPVWLIPASIFRTLGEEAGSAFESATRLVAQLLAIGVILVVLWRFAVTVRASADNTRESPGDVPLWTRPLLASTALIFATLAFVPVNTHPWYWSWPVVPIALLVAWDGDENGRRPSHRWLVPWMLLTAVLTIGYHTRIVHT